LYGVPRIERIERLWVDGVEIPAEYYATVAEPLSTQILAEGMTWQPRDESLKYGVSVTESARRVIAEAFKVPTWLLDSTHAVRDLVGDGQVDLIRHLYMHSIGDFVSWDDPRLNANNCHADFRELYSTPPRFNAYRSVGFSFSVPLKDWASDLQADLIKHIYHYDRAIKLIESVRKETGDPRLNLPHTLTADKVQEIADHLRSDFIYVRPRQIGKSFYTPSGRFSEGAQANKPQHRTENTTHTAKQMTHAEKVADLESLAAQSCRCDGGNTTGCSSCVAFRQLQLLNLNRPKNDTERACP
jgi:hypothetical protein